MYKPVKILCENDIDTIIETEDAKKLDKPQHASIRSKSHLDQTPMKFGLGHDITDISAEFVNINDTVARMTVNVIEHCIDYTTDSFLRISQYIHHADMKLELVEFLIFVSVEFHQKVVSHGIMHLCVRRKLAVFSETQFNKMMVELLTDPDKVNAILVLTTDIEGRSSSGTQERVLQNFTD